MKKSGFTLTEMLVTLSVLAILMSVAAPNFKTFIGNGNMVSNANGMIGAFNYARIEAVKRGSTVYLGQVVADSWTSGVVVWVDNDGSTTFTAGEELRLWPAFESGSSVDSSNQKTSFAFRGTGEVDNDDTLTICDDRTGEKGMEVSILVSGAVFAEKVTCV